MSLFGLQLLLFLLLLLLSQFFLLLLSVLLSKLVTFLLPLKGSLLHLRQQTSFCLWFCIFLLLLSLQHLKRLSFFVGWLLTEIQIKDHLLRVTHITINTSLLLVKASIAIPVEVRL